MHYSASFLCLLLRTIILSAPALRPRYSVRRRPFFDGAVFGAVAVRERRPPHSARQGPGVAQNRRAHGGASERVPPVVRARARKTPRMHHPCREAECKLYKAHLHTPFGHPAGTWPSWKRSTSGTKAASASPPNSTF